MVALSVLVPSGCQALGAIRIKDHGAGLVEGAAWAVVHEDLTLTANHREIINTIAHRLRAYW